MSSRSQSSRYLRSTFRHAAISILVLSSLAILSLSCGHSGQANIAILTGESDQVLWEEGLKAIEKNQFEPARQYFKRVIDGFPQSPWVPSARLALADAYFKEGGPANYVLAAAEYGDFIAVYPSHARADYAQLQLGECYFKQRNGPERDQTQTERALEEFERLVDLHPDSPHVATARKRIETCRQEQARAEFLAGYFYQRTRRAYHSAILRYQGVINSYSDYHQLPEVLYRISECLYLSDRGKEALPHLTRLVKEYPKSEYKVGSERLIKAIENPKPTPTPAARPKVPLENIQKKP